MSVRHTKFDEEAEDGECSNSPPPAKRSRPLEPAASDDLKGTETDYGEFLMDRSESNAVDDDDICEVAAEGEDEKPKTPSLWAQRVMGGLLSGSDLSLNEKPTPERRRGPTCFNCDGEHALRECKERRDQRRIQKAMNEHKERMRERNKGNARYHVDEGKPAKYKPGRLSEALQKALGIGSDDVPEWVYRMRRMGFVPGYPPGYLRKSLVSAAKPESEFLSFHNIDGTVEGAEDGALPEEDDGEFKEMAAPTIDRDSVIYYMGFNMTYRNLRDRESNFRVPPFREFCDFLQEHTNKEHAKREQERRRIHEREKKLVPRNKVKKLDEDDEVVVLTSSVDDDVMVIDKKPTKEEADESVGGSGSAASPPAPATPGSSKQDKEGTPMSITPKGHSIVCSPGTPVPLRRNASDKKLIQSTSVPDLAKFSVGIVPFSVEEDVTSNKGFFRGLMKKIKERLTK